MAAEKEQASSRITPSFPLYLLRLHPRHRPWRGFETACNVRLSLILKILKKVHHLLVGGCLSAYDDCIMPLVSCLPRFVGKQNRRSPPLFLLLISLPPPPPPFFFFLKPPLLVAPPQPCRSKRTKGRPLSPRFAAPIVAVRPTDTPGLLHILNIHERTPRASFFDVLFLVNEPWSSGSHDGSAAASS